MDEENLQRENEDLKKQLADKDREIKKITRDKDRELQKSQRIIRDKNREIQKVTRNKDRKIRGLKKKNEELRTESRKLKTESNILRKRLRLHDGPHTPSSKMMIKKKVRMRPKSGRKRGGQPGHRSTARRVKPDRIVDYILSNCTECDSRNIRTVSTNNRDITEMRKTVTVETTRNTTHGYECCDCKARFESEAPGVPARGAYGPNVIAEVFGMYLNRMTYKMIERELRRMGLPISAATISEILKRVSTHNLEEPTGEILAKIRAADILCMDETSMPLNGKNVWIWTFIDPVNDNMFYHVQDSRGAKVLEEVLPGWDGMAVTDGWRAYGRFVAQRCWAHIIREAHDIAEKNRTASTCRMSENLGKIMDDALKISENGDLSYRRRAVWRLRRRVRDLIDRYRGNPRFGGFVTKLERALPDLFRFVLDSRIPHTNNVAERGLREIVIHRKIRGGIRSEDTMKWMGNLFTCTATWRQQGLDVMANVARYV